MSDSRPAVRCGSCKLNQFAQQWCRRCYAPLPRPVVPLPPPRDPQEWEMSLANLTHLPTLEDVRAFLIKEATRRTGSKITAAKMIGIGRTTIYRRTKVKQIA